jgi:lipopolysaccharide export system permease protein
MRQYERYLFSHLLWPTVLITVSLTSIVWLTQVLRFLDFMLNRGLGVGDFLYLTGLMLPQLLLMLIPVSLGVAVIYTYNRLTVESELIVLNAVGVSKWQLAKPALMMGMAAAVLCYGLAIYLAPSANAHFRDIRVFFRDKYASVLLEEDVFNNPIDGVTVFVRERDDKNNLAGILLHDSRDPKQTITMLADRGRMEQGSSGPRFYLQHGVRQELRNGRVSWLSFDDYAIDIAFYGHEAKFKPVPEEMRFGDLFTRNGFTPKQIAANRAEIHQRLTWPSFAMTLPLFVLAVLFTGEFNRRGAWRRIIFASVGMAVMVLAYFALRDLTAKHSMLMLTLYLTVFGSGCFSAYLIISNRRIRMAWPTKLLPQPAEAP